MNFEKKNHDLLQKKKHFQRILYDLQEKNHIEELCKRLLVKDLIKTTEFAISSSFLRDSNPNSG